MTYRTQGGPRVYRSNGTVVGKANSHGDAELFADELNKAAAPKIMKRYSEDCKPTAAGWYWVAYQSFVACRIFGPVPMYYSGTDWHESESMDYTPHILPGWWIEMEFPSIAESKA